MPDWKSKSCTTFGINSTRKRTQCVNNKVRVRTMEPFQGTTENAIRKCHRRFCALPQTASNQHQIVAMFEQWWLSGKSPSRFGSKSAWNALHRRLPMPMLSPTSMVSYTAQLGIERAVNRTNIKSDKSSRRDFLPFCNRFSPWEKNYFSSEWTLFFVGFLSSLNFALHLLALGRANKKQNITLTVHTVVKPPKFSRANKLLPLLHQKVVFSTPAARLLQRKNRLTVGLGLLARKLIILL